MRGWAAQDGVGLELGGIIITIIIIIVIINYWQLGASGEVEI